MLAPQSTLLLAAEALFTPREHRLQRLTNYLTNVSANGLITSEVVDLTWKAWEKVSAPTSERMPAPDACPGPDGQILLSWERGPHYLELEVFADGHGEFFYRNEDTGAPFDLDYAVGTLVPTEVVDKLFLFV